MIILFGTLLGFVLYPYFLARVIKAELKEKHDWEAYVVLGIIGLVVWTYFSTNTTFTL